MTASRFRSLGAGLGLLVRVVPGVWLALECWALLCWGMENASAALRVQRVRRNPGWWLGAGLALLVMGLPGVGIVVEYSALLVSGTETTARVVAENGGSWYEVVYGDRSGVLTSSEPHEVGDRVTVLRLDGDGSFETRSDVVGMMVAGIVMILFSTLLVIAAARPGPRIESLPGTPNEPSEPKAAMLQHPARHVAASEAPQRGRKRVPGGASQPQCSPTRRP